MKKQKLLFTKKLFGFLLALVMVCSLIPLMPQQVEAAADGFYTSGTSIYDANGNKFIMRGVNIAHAWYPNETETSIKAAAGKGANCVRIVCSDGKQYTKTTASELQKIIDTCKQNKVVAIVEVHDATGSDSTSDLNAAVDYWKEMKSIINNNRKYVIVNIANEWYGTWDGGAWASGYQTAIRNMRNAGIHNLLMVDCAGWGQYPDSIKYNGKSVIQADSDNNIMFSIHMYEYAGSDANTVRTNIDNALATGVPLIIGEFGFKHTNGDVDEYTIMQYCQQKGAGYMGWSWKGNGDTWAYLDLAKSWDGSNLSDWGNTLFYGDNGISKTASTCSVFTGSGSSSGSNTGNSGNSSGGSNTGNSGSGNSGSDYNTNGLDGVYYIKNAYSGKYLDIVNAYSSNGTNVQQYEFNGCTAQQFKLVNDGNGYYSILTACSDFKSCVDVYRGSSSNGTNIQQWSYHGGNSQKFQFVKSGDKYIIKTKASNCYSCLDLYAWEKGNCGNIAQWEFLNGENQLWYLEKVSGNNSGSSSSSGSTSGNNSGNGSSGSSSSNTGASNNYKSLFWGSNSSSNWNQAVSVMTSKNGGSFNGSDVTKGGCFYIEYDGNKDDLELILQSWSGGASWAKVSISESGSANCHRYIKCSYDNCVSAFGTSDFGNKLDQVHVSAKSGSITVYSVCYVY